MKAKLVLSALVMVFCVSVQTAGEARADSEAGRDAAERICASCHAISPFDAVSPSPNATAFREIADKAFWTRTALLVWFQTPHPTMPNLILDLDDKDDIIDYILSLKSTE